MNFLSNILVYLVAIAIALSVHEFGHALGLGHNERKDVMSKFSNVTELTENDKKSYDAAYRKY